MRHRQELGLTKEARTILIWMCVLICVNQLGFGAIVPVVALYAEDFGVSQTAIGMTIAIYGLARFLVNVPAGQLADAAGRRVTLAAGGIVTVVGAVLCAVAPTYGIFLLARFIAGAGAACVLTGGQIVLADIASPGNRGRVMAIYQGVFLFSVGAGSWPGGWLADTFNLATPFWANAILAAVVTLLAWFFVPETRDHGRDMSATTPRPPSLPMGEQLRRLGASPGFVLVSIVSFAAFFARTGGLFNVIPLLAEDQIGLAPDQIGLGIGMISIVGLVLVYPSGALVDRFGRKAVIVPSTLLSAVAIVGFALAQDFPQFMIASTFWAAASGIAGAAPAAYAADVAPRGMMANAMGMYRTLADSGYVLGPLVLGVISDLASPEAALGFTAILLIGAGSMFAIRAPETLHTKVSPG
ncbi:MAG TPA: MFS transporter [Thermomicrobiales bacterium]|nr:MFS transporter [Thermomicrobiales bacterium]